MLNVQDFLVEHNDDRKLWDLPLLDFDLPRELEASDA